MLTLLLLFPYYNNYYYLNYPISKFYQPGSTCAFRQKRRWGRLRQKRWQWGEKNQAQHWRHTGRER